MKILPDRDRVRLVDFITRAVAARSGIGMEPALPMPPPIWHRWMAGDAVSLGDLAQAISIRLRVPHQVTHHLVEAALGRCDRGRLLAIAAAGESLARPSHQLAGPAVCWDWLQLGEAQRAGLVGSGDYVATPKLDGIRANVTIGGPACVSITTRAGRPLIGGWFPSLGLELYERFQDWPCMLDGELLSHDGTWASTVREISSGGDRLRFHIFDAVPLSEWQGNQVVGFQMRAVDRWAQLRERLPLCSEDLVAAVAREPVMGVGHAERLCDQYRAAGHEGVVLHHRFASYHPGSSRAWIKIKRWRSAEFYVTGITSTAKGVSLEIHGAADGRFIRSRVSTGIDATTRAAIAADLAGWSKALVEVRFQEVTAAGALRFPVFLRRRDLEDAL